MVENLKAGTGTLEFSHGGLDYVLDDAGKLTETVGGTTKDVVKLDKLRDVSQSLIDHAAESRHEKGVLDALKDDKFMSPLKKMSGKGEYYKKANKLQKAAGYASEVIDKAGTGLTPATDKEIRGLLVGGGREVEALLPSATRTMLKKEMNATALAEVRSAYNALHEAGKEPTKDGIKAVLRSPKHLKHGQEAMDILEKTEKAGYFNKIDEALGDVAFENLPKKVANQISKRTVEITEKLQAWENKNSALLELEAKSGTKPSAIDKLREDLTKIEEKLIKETSDDVGKVAGKKMLKGGSTKKLFETIMEDSPAMKEHFSALKKGAVSDVVVSGSKAAGTVSTGLFYKAESAQRALAKEKGIAVEALSLTQKLHGGKVAAAMVGLGIAGYVAGIGRPGKAAQQNQEQQAALMQQADGQVAAR